MRSSPGCTTCRTIRRIWSRASCCGSTCPILRQWEQRPAITSLRQRSRLNSGRSGLLALRRASTKAAAEHRDYLISRYQIPDPRTELGPLLSGIAHAMIDVSDGLLADLGHICETSHAGASVELDSLPLSPAAQAVVDSDPGIRPRLAVAGDDYELLFTAPIEATEAIGALSLRLGISITMIGKIEPGSGVRLVDADGRIILLDHAGYRHF